MDINKGIISVLCSFTAASSAISIGSALSKQTDTLPYTEYYCNHDETNAFYSDDTEYTVKEHDGMVGVFDADGELIEMIEISVITLPMAERKRLESGFEVSGDAELNKLKEAYCG